MKARSILMTLALCFVASAAHAADSPHMGTWKLNEAKSKLSEAAPKTSSITYEAAAGDSVKVTVDGVDGEGKPVHNVWTGKFDGKDYPVTGDSTSDARSYVRVDDHTLTFTAKKAGKVTMTGKIVVAADGKSRTVTTNGTDAKGGKYETTAAYDKQ